MIGMLRSRLVIKPSFRLVTPLNIGFMGEREVLRATFKVPMQGKETPIIPQSSIKGALRAITERIARSVEWKDQDVRNAVEMHFERNIITHRGSSPERFQQLLAEYKSSGRFDEIVKHVQETLGLSVNEAQEGEENERRILEAFLATKCPIDNLFGCTEYSGMLRLTDFIPTGSPELARYTGIGIDRKSMKVFEQAIYQVEMIMPTVSFTGLIVVDNLIPGDHISRLFALMWKFIKQLGLQIGGRKSVGFGLLQIEDIKASYVDFLQLKDASERIKALADPWNFGKTFDSLDSLITFLETGHL
ncbi:MAG: RAMP superfamily CRISPR-associated protein [Candidatus Baldrarchaeia archaeon]